MLEEAPNLHNVAGLIASRLPMFAGLVTEVEGKQNNQNKKTPSKTICRMFLSQGYGYNKSDLAKQSLSSLNTSECKDGFLPVRMRYDCSAKTAN